MSGLAQLYTNIFKEDENYTCTYRLFKKKRKMQQYLH